MEQEITVSAHLANEESPSISARLVGPDEDNGQVRFEDFRFFCNKLAECVHRIEKIITKEHAQIRYRIIALESKSAGITIEAVRPKKGEDHRGEVVSFFANTVESLQQGNGVDQRLAFDDLRAFRELHGGLKKTKQLWFNEREITHQYIANIDVILGRVFKSEGSVKGKLEGLNVHNKSECVLYPPVRGIKVICAFPESMFEKVRAAIKSNVTLFGTVFHKPDKGFPERIQIKEIVVHDPVKAVLLKDLKGTFGDCTEGLGAVEFVRKIRDGQD